MSLSAGSSAIRGDQSTLAKDKHRSRELPEPRVLACRACRKKKHLCDRRKPSCTTCLTVGIECIYAGRKPHTTVSELEDILQKLEDKYAACLKAKKRHGKDRKDSAKLGSSSTSSRQEETDAIHLSDRILINPADLERSMQSVISGLDLPLTNTLYGGYHFDEKFLTTPSIDNRYMPNLSVVLSETSQSEGSLASASHPTRIFTPITRYPPILSTDMQDDPTNLGLPPNTEDVISEVQRAVSIVVPPTQPEPPVVYRLDQPQWDTDDLSPSPSSTDPTEETHQHSPCPTAVEAYQRRTQTPPSMDITHAPSLNFSRATWWDCLLNTYSILPNASYTVNSRQDAALEISQDVCGFFKLAPIWLSFINVPLFFDMFHHTELRSAIQPSLILGILAYAKLLQSDRDMTDLNRTPEERDRVWRQSVILRDLAQASFEASYTAGWLDMPLAQAAWILVLYEVCSHPECSSYRMQSAMMLLDNVIRALGLTSIDAMDPRAPVFSANTVPALGRPRPNGTRDYTRQLGYSIDSSAPYPPSTVSPGVVKYQAAAFPTPFDNWRSPVDQPRYSKANHGLKGSERCPCEALSFARSPEVARSTPTWTDMPRWAPDATWAEIRKEEARRLVWSAVIMLGCDAAARQAGGLPQLDLHISNPENFALLYAGEENYSSLPGVDKMYSGKESNWALWSRTMLLWFACLKHASRGRPNAPLSGFSMSPASVDDEAVGRDDAGFAMRTWMETLAIEEALEAHTCETEKAMMYQAREYIFTIRMQVSGGFRSSIPLPQTGVNYSMLDRDSAMQWIRQLNSIGTTLISVIYGGEAHSGRKMMIKRPFMAYLCVGVVWRALELWKLDNTLSPAIEVAVKFRQIVDWFEGIWPCAEIQRWAAKALAELESICGLLGEYEIP
ncbi:hypothetical protein FRB94_001764 [Tulasnella sp. JGI-2019a]|nr:hypothetical protein FRB93_002038 [Tulasnella sp. JGI-2019a]KAG9005216.1 hypothetical protein FRB94_001764 [Tulasnella sp. JGI-2019a]